ncbi:MAG: hypothetical protein RR585_01470 [Coprobacillus sp.]
MTANDFWYGDEYLLNVYIKAYFNKTKYEAWQTGYYNYVAQITALSNSFGGKKGKNIEYPDFSSFEEKQKIIEVKEEPRGKNDNKYLSQFY